MSQSVCPTKFNCESADAWEPNSDIAGLGVLIGFVGTGYLVFALLVVHYLVAYEPELPPPQQTPDNERISQAASREHLTGNLSEISVAGVDTATDPMYWEPNPIDVNLLAWVRSWTAKLLGFLGASLPLVGQATSNHISRCFSMCIIAMCDVQIVTGMSILIGGFVCLDERLSALHWQIITYLAWFSCVTHLSGLTILRRYFQTHPREKSLRVTLMFVLLVILIVAIVPSGFFNWRSPRADSSAIQATAASAKTSAACFYNLSCAKRLYQDSLWMNCTTSCSQSFDAPETLESCELRTKPETTGYFDCRWLTQSSAMQEMIVSTVLLVFGFISRTIKLSAHVSSTISRRLTLPVGTFTLYCFAKLQDLVAAPDARATTRWHARTLLFEAWRGFVVRPLLAVVIFVSAHIDLFNSMLGELSWLLAILLWGTSKVLSPHYDEEYYANDHTDKRQQTKEEHSTRWEFGQVLPVLLLAAPLVAVLGTFASAEKPGETNQSGDRVEVPRTNFGNIANGYGRPRQSDGDTLEMTTLSTTGSRSIVGRQHEDDVIHDDTSYVEPSISP
ncbi:hypothetical protein BDP55DRAFT_736501 [Colletotrichum godetiae]|uniref:Uncharacterized protein n=1 Tax=Colletotrichum godetiae TaxID=1209918 RepID=A0AAJ0F5E9_9PEZI|nr:uncharacterized protein BDP55DRAFT_736501 [Colletotrichum godetiae]KAK1701357.1 hypothetical protein BDP55DRAFT_736501 [Colletotrichum godetiae]